MTNKDVYHSPKTKPPFFYGYVIVIAAFIIQLLMFGQRNSFGVFFKPLLTEFGWTRALISGAFSISTIVQGLSGILMGGLNDRLGPRVVMTLCGFLLGLGVLLMSQINAAWHLYLLYVVMVGIGMGGIYAPQMSTVARWFIDRRSVMTGIVAAGGGIGGLITPPIINWLIAIFGWRNSYIIMGTLILVILISAAQFLRRDPAKMGQEPYGENKGVEQRLNLATNGFSLREAIYTIQFWMTAAILFCWAFCVVTIMVHIVPHTTDLGISATTAANVLAVIGVGILAGVMVLGSVADRIGTRQAYIICFILISTALFWLLIAREVWMLYIIAAIIGFGGGGVTLASPMVADLFGIRSHGLILGACFFCQTIGSAAGPFMAGYVFDLTGSYQVAFIVSAAASVVGLILAVILRPIKRQSTPNSLNPSTQAAPQF
jgi:MFS family permease